MKKYIIKNIIILIIIIICSSYTSFIERRLLGLFQNRYGPNRVGWEGSMQLIADMIKIIFKEDWIPNFSENIFFILSPIISFIIPLITFYIIPITKKHTLYDNNISILFIIMIISFNIYPIMFAGWASNNKYSLLGSIRAVAQTLSYEIFIGLSLIGVVAKTGSFQITKIIEQQKNIWNIFPQFLGFITFFISSIAVCHRHPFDQPESEQELSDGYHIEYSGMKFGLFYIGQYINLITMSSLLTTIFLGGWLGYKLYPIIWFIIKNIIFIILFILIRASIPRPKYDHVMKFGWIICLPLTLINLLFTASIILIKYYY